MSEQGQLPTYPAAGDAEGMFGADLFAPWWRRAVAYLLDGVVVGALAAVIALATGHHQLLDSLLRFHRVHGRLRPIAPGSRLAIYNAVTEVLAFVYALSFLASRWQSTPGMRLLTVHLATEGELDRPRLGRVAARTAIYTGIAFLATRFPLGFLLVAVDLLWPLWDAKRQTLHDKLARTVVLRGSP